MISTDEGVLHAPPLRFGKMPEKLMHDPSITDGAKVLYSHMHWRYGNNQRNFEGYASMAKYMDVSNPAIAHRLQELEAADWIVIVPRAEFGVGRLTNIYHVFVNQKECIAWRVENNYPKPDYSTLQKRISRAGKGNPNPKRPNVNSGSVTVLNLGSDKVVNSGSSELDSEEYLDSNYTDLLIRDASNDDRVAAFEDEFEQDVENAQEEAKQRQAKASAKRLSTSKSLSLPKEKGAAPKEKVRPINADLKDVVAEQIQGINRALGNTITGLLAAAAGRVCCAMYGKDKLSAEDYAAVTRSIPAYVVWRKNKYPDIGLPKSDWRKFEASYSEFMSETVFGSQSQSDYVTIPHPDKAMAAAGITKTVHRSQLGATS